MAVERLDVAQDLARFLELVGVEQPAAHQEADRAPGIHHVAADAAVQVFLVRDGVQRGGRVLVGEFLLQHAGRDFFEAFVDAFQRVGRILGVGRVQVEQHVHIVFDRAGPRTRAHAHQAEHGQVVVMDREQDFAGQDEGHRDHPRRAVFFFEQKVGAQVQVAVFGLVVARRGFDVLHFVLARQGDAVLGLDPGALFFVRIGQVDPDRRDVFQVFPGSDRCLVQAAIL